MITEAEATENPTLNQLVERDSELKTAVVEIVGGKTGEENVTVQMIVEAMAEDFPEFLMVVAEENWVRGYHQALEDVDAGRNAEVTEESSQEEKSV